MSSIYNTEPQPTASAILHTTQGDISLELFAKQTPLTCRNFLQHCLDGYYDNTIFHRLVPGFVLQGGDPTGTGNGGECIYDGGAFGGDLDPWPMDQRRGKNAGGMGVNLKDEFHSRLKFNRRGLLGMANEGVPDSNGSQFFFTLDKAEELNGKNTMFGRVAGDNTIYNLAKMGEAEVEEGGERPLYPCSITGVEILVNPFDDMKQRERIAKRTTEPVAPKKKEKKRKGGKQLLSFGDDEGDGDVEVPLPKKPKFDTRIVQDVEDSTIPQKNRLSKSSKKDGNIAKTVVPIRESPEKKEAPHIEPSPPPEPPKKESSKPPYEDVHSLETEPPKKKSKLEKTNEEIAALKASMKRTIRAEPEKEEKMTALERMIPETSTRGRKRRPGGINPTANEEREAVDFLKAFKSKLDNAPAEKKGTVSSTVETGEDKAEDGTAEEEPCDLHFIVDCQSCKAWDKAEAKEESDDEGWMSHTLSFAADKLGKDLSYRKKAEEELIVIDPREKARNIKEGRRADRNSKGGGSGRAWDDQARNARMARSSALAGRGAK